LEALKDQAKVLDRLFVYTRYPNGLPDLAPMEAFGMKDFQAALEAADRLLCFAEAYIK